VDTILNVHEYKITQFLNKGSYQLIVAAPFECQLTVVPYNPPAGLEFNADQDPSAFNWNSKLSVQRNENYTFLIRLNQPIASTQLFIQFLWLGASEPIPPQNNPPTIPPQPPTPPPVSQDHINQQRYKNMGYEIAGDGSVIFYCVVARRNKISDVREVCVSGYNAWSVDVHDPVNTIARYANARLQHPYKDWEYYYRGPFPSPAPAEDLASNIARNYFGDPTMYGLQRVQNRTRQPAFD
jgi:hypothetical protein